MPASKLQFDNFLAGFDKGLPQLVHCELIADTQTPVSAYLKLAGNKAHCFLLESVEGGSVRGRFSVIGIAPDLIWRCRNGVAEINHAPQETNQFIADDKPPLTSLRALMAKSAMTDTGDLPPMAAGLFGYFGYDMIRHIETIPNRNKAAIDMDESFLLRPSLIAILTG